VDVSKYALDGEWIEVEVVSDRAVEPFRFKVQPIGSTGFMAASKSPDEVTTLCVEAVIEWNLTTGEEPLPCDEKNKRYYLSRFATYMVKAMNGKPPAQATNLAGAIVGFAASPDSFLKN
jgi:hypothetical protein